MMFLIRTAFWLSVVVVLLPTPESMKTPETKIGTAEAMSAASATMSDVRGFCERQPEACKVGSQAMTAFGYKAQASAKWVYEFLSDKLKSEPAGTASSEPKATVELGNGSQHTLTPADAAPAWRGPQPQRQAEMKR